MGRCRLNNISPHHLAEGPRQSRDNKATGRSPLPVTARPFRWNRKAKQSLPMLHKMTYRLDIELPVSLRHSNFRLCHMRLPRRPAKAGLLAMTFWVFFRGPDCIGGARLEHPTPLYITLSLYECRRRRRKAVGNALLKNRLQAAYRAPRPDYNSASWTEQGIDRLPGRPITDSPAAALPA